MSLPPSAHPNRHSVVRRQSLDTVVGAVAVAGGHYKCRRRRNSYRTAIRSRGVSRRTQSWAQLQPQEDVVRVAAAVSTSEPPFGCEASVVGVSAPP